MQVENVAPIEVTGMRETGLMEITSRQNALTARVDRIENHLNVIAQDQNNAAESNQALWDNLGKCADLVRQLQIERILATHQQPHEQNRSDQEFGEQVYRTFTLIPDEFTARKRAFEQVKNNVLRSSIAA